MSDLAETIRQRMGECSPAERKVARTLLADFPMAGLQTATAIAALAGVSTPTVIRFVSRLGFSGFPDFHSTVRDEVAGRTASPVVLYDATDFASTSAADTGDLAARSGRTLAQAVSETLATAPPSELAAATELLADPRRRVHVLGGRFTQLLGDYLVLHLTQLREEVQPLPERAVERSAALAGLGKKDVLVVFDYRRYEPTSHRIAELAKARSSSVLLFTDPWLSPISSISDVVLPTRVDSPSPYDSLVPLLALIETIVTGVLSRLGERARTRMRHIEDLTQQYDLYQG